jgi:hypothetical protein
MRKLILLAVVAMLVGCAGGQLSFNDLYDITSPQKIVPIGGREVVDAMCEDTNDIGLSGSCIPLGAKVYSTLTLLFNSNQTVTGRSTFRCGGNNQGVAPGSIRAIVKCLRVPGPVTPPDVAEQ